MRAFSAAFPAWAVLAAGALAAPAPAPAPPDPPLTVVSPPAAAKPKPKPAKPSTEISENPPLLIATAPPIGAADVDPSLSAITLTFDRDMGEGVSWLGSGEIFPKPPPGAKPRWLDKRTCSIPVKLEPGRYYRAGINSTEYHNFRSAPGGEPADPAVLYFCTAGATDEVKRRMERPRIVETSPPMNAEGVDPSMAEIRVVFSVPMARQASWTGDLSGYPKLAKGSKYRWSEDSRTVIMPVEMEPGRSYLLGLNARSFNNFQSRWGVPLEPAALSFRTRP